jgi:hypothetical protein
MCLSSSLHLLLLLVHVSPAISFRSHSRVEAGNVEAGDNLTEDNNTEDNNKLCSQTYSVESFVRASATWCDPMLVPESQRAPKKLQGLFWLKDLPLEDVAACFSLGTWNQEKLELRVGVFDTFTFLANEEGKALGKRLYYCGMTYRMTFTNASLVEADIKAYAEGSLGQRIGGWLGTTLFRKLLEFPMIELPGGAAGDIWDRPSYSRITGEKIGGYTPVRMLTGKLQVKEDVNAQFVAVESKKNDNIIRYWAKTGSSC